MRCAGQLAPLGCGEKRETVGQESGRGLLIQYWGQEERGGKPCWQHLSSHIVGVGLSQNSLVMSSLGFSSLHKSHQDVTKPVCHWTNVLSINNYWNIVSQSSKNYKQYENTLSLSVRLSWPEGSALPTGPHVCPRKCRIEAKVKCEWRWAEKIQLEIKGRCHDWITRVKRVLGQLSKERLWTPFGLCSRVEWWDEEEEVSPMSIFSAGPTGLSAPVSAVTAVLPTRGHFTVSTVLNFPQWWYDWFEGVNGFSCKPRQCAGLSHSLQKKKNCKA